MEGRQRGVKAGLRRQSGSGFLRNCRKFWLAEVDSRAGVLQDVGNFERLQTRIEGTTMSPARKQAMKTCTAWMELSQ